MNAGYRRGRSARAASPPLELPPNRRSRREGREGHNSDMDPPSNAPSPYPTSGDHSRTPTPHPAASQPASQVLGDEGAHGEPLP